MAKHRSTQTMPYDSPGTLVFWWQKSFRNSNGVTPNGPPIYYIVTWALCLGPPEFTYQTAPQSVQPFLHESQTFLSDRHTDRPRHNRCSNKLHLYTLHVRCELKVTCQNLMQFSDNCYTCLQLSVSDVLYYKTHQNFNVIAQMTFSNEYLTFSTTAEMKISLRVTHIQQTW